MTLHERLVYLKTSRNILQKDIAHAIGLSLRAYQYYERGDREPTASNLIALADYFNVSIDYLVGRTDNPEINR
jgi:transcriptional regulator with XRE-family HTH domain